MKKLLVFLITVFMANRASASALDLDWDSDLVSDLTSGLTSNQDSEASTSKLSLFPSLNDDPDSKRTFQELIESRGFSLQEYSLRTADGYILTLHRVVTKDYNSSYSKTRKPVIVQHGLLGSSNNFFITSPVLGPKDNSSKCGDNFGFCLIMTGNYDIWLPNSRGNGYSDGHDSGLSTKDKEYWNFTFDEMALYDTPVAIEFIQKATGYEKIGFIGYSQGANILLALLSLKPEYSEILVPAMVWAPPAYIGNMSSIARFAYPAAPFFQRLGGKFIISTSFAQKLVELACGIGQPICVPLLNMVMGDTTHLNQTRLATYFHYFPSPVSTWDVIHFSQLYGTGKFTRFDYKNRKQNEAKYGQKKPPLYPLENITKNKTIVVFRGNTDGYIANEDAERLISDLRSYGVKIIDNKVESDTWNHLDFMIGTGAGKLVYDKTIELLDQLS